MPRTMLFPSRMTASADAVRTAADARGLTTVQPAAVHLPEDLAADHLHVGPTFANVAWTSGIYVSDIDAALDVILRAAAPAGDLPSHDRAFVRPVPARTISTEGELR